LNKVFVEGIVEGMHASPLLEAVTVAETDVGAGAGAGADAGAGVDVTGVAGAPLLALLLDPQPLIAEIKNKNVSGAIAVNARDL
jgi:hypothetical protein